MEQDLKRLLARELHDRVAQTLTTMLVDLENFKSDQAGRNSVVRQVGQFQDSTRDVLNSLRQLLYELRGEEPVNEGFVDSVNALAERFRVSTGVEVRLSVLAGWPSVLRAPASSNLYHIIQEALVNIRNHSGAKVVNIVLEPISDTHLAVRVSDDGRGLEPSDPRPLGMGMVGMKERAMFLGGELLIENRGGGGTAVNGLFPRELLAPRSLEDTDLAVPAVGPRGTTVVARRRAI